MRLWSSAGRQTAAGEAESFDFSSGRMGENTEVLCSYLCSAYYIYMLLTSVRHVCQERTNSVNQLMIN